MLGRPCRSLVGLVRTWGDSPEGSTIHLVTATDWRDPASYKQSDNLLFPPELVNKNGLEDPHMYLDASGRCHAVFHGAIPEPRCWVGCARVQAACARCHFT